MGNRRRLVNRIARRISRGLKVAGISRGEAENIAYDILKGSGWRVEDVERQGNKWEVTSQGQGVGGVLVGISFLLDPTGRVVLGRVEISGMDAETYDEIGTVRVSRIIRPQEAARRLKR